MWSWGWSWGIIEPIVWLEPRLTCRGTLSLAEAVSEWGFRICCRLDWSQDYGNPWDIGDDNVASEFIIDVDSIFVWLPLLSFHP